MHPEHSKVAIDTDMLAKQLAAQPLESTVALFNSFFETLAAKDGNKEAIDLIAGNLDPIAKEAIRQMSTTIAFIDHIKSGQRVAGLDLNLLKLNGTNGKKD